MSIVFEVMRDMKKKDKNENWIAKMDMAAADKQAAEANDLKDAEIAMQMIQTNHRMRLRIANWKAKNKQDQSKVKKVNFKD